MSVQTTRSWVFFGILAFLSQRHLFKQSSEKSHLCESILTDTGRFCTCNVPLTNITRSAGITTCGASVTSECKTRVAQEVSCYIPINFRVVQWLDGIVDPSVCERLQGVAFNGWQK